MYYVQKLECICVCLCTLSKMNDFCSSRKAFFKNKCMILYMKSTVITGNHAISAERLYLKKQSASH